MATVLLKPVEDRRVLNHQRDFRPLAPEGEMVDLDREFRRAIAAGDAVIVAPTAPAAARKKADA